MTPPMQARARVVLVLLFCCGVILAGASFMADGSVLR